MKVGCKGGGGETYAGFPLGQNLITSDMMTTNVLSFDLGADFWDDDNYDTVVTITTRYYYSTPNPIPLPKSYDDYSRLSYSIHRQRYGSTRAWVTMNLNTHNVELKISRDNLITKSSTNTIILTGVFINKTAYPISWNYS